MSRKGQEAAPIELMIGVTVLAFVLVIAYYVYSNAAASQCVEKIRASSAQLARTIEEVAQQGPGTTRYVTVGFSCQSQNVKVSYITIAEGPDQTCQRMAGASRCYMLYVIGDESGQLTVIHSELLRNVGESVGIKYKVGGEETKMKCDYNSLVAYLKDGSGCDAGAFIKAGEYSFRITKQKGGPGDEKEYYVVIENLLAPEEGTS